MIIFLPNTTRHHLFAPRTNFGEIDPCCFLMFMFFSGLTKERGLTQFELYSAKKQIFKERFGNFFEKSFRRRHETRFVCKVSISPTFYAQA
jgi:hypothetical protein